MNKKIIKICEQKFIYLNYSPRTKENYLSHINKFIDSIGEKQIIHLSAKDFQNYLDNYKFTSVSQQNQVINSIRFLYKYGLEKKYDKVSFKRPKSEKKFPDIHAVLKKWQQGAPNQIGINPNFLKTLSDVLGHYEVHLNFGKDHTGIKVTLSDYHENDCLGLIMPLMVNK